MRRIKNYRPPSAVDLLRMKADLGFTNAEMADLAGLAKGSQWRKHTGGVEPRPMGMQMNFYIAALLTLGDDELSKVFQKMREQGAVIDVV